MKTTRRQLFGLFGGLVASRFVPEQARYVQWNGLQSTLSGSETIYYPADAIKGYGGGPIHGVTVCIDGRAVAEAMTGHFDMMKTRTIEGRGLVRRVPWNLDHV